MADDLKTIISGVDPKKIRVDAGGRILIDDPDLRKRLAELAPIDSALDTTINGYKCACKND